MKISFKRMLALVLCAAMVFGMLPMQQVRAEDDYFIGGFIANNTAELVEALTEAERLVAPEKLVTVQIGEPFELTENVSVPGGCRLDVPVPFTIGEGVTMSVSGDLEVVADTGHRATLRNDVAEVVQKRENLLLAHRIRVLLLDSFNLCRDAVVHILGCTLEDMTV